VPISTTFTICRWAMFFLWFTLYFAESRRWILTAIFAVVSLSVREDVAFGLR